MVEHGRPSANTDLRAGYEWKGSNALTKTRTGIERLTKEKWRDRWFESRLLRGRVVRTPMETVDEDSFRCESASDHRAALQPCTPRRGMPLPPKILVCAAIVKMRDEHRLRGSCVTELLEAYRA
jgi:hypothetical protein